MDTSKLTGRANFSISYRSNGNNRTITRQGAICYLEIINCIADSNKTINSIKIYFNPKHLHRGWVEFCLNCPQFGEVFLDKDIDRQLKEGFDINLDSPSNLAMFGMISLRTSVEHKLDFNWWLKKGFSPEEIFILHAYVHKTSTKFTPRMSHNHMPFNGGWKNFKLNKKQFLQKSIKEHGKCSGVYSLFSGEEKHPFIGKNIYKIDKLFNLCYYSNPLTFKDIKKFIEKDYRTCVD